MKIEICICHNINSVIVYILLTEIYLFSIYYLLGLCMVFLNFGSILVLVGLLCIRFCVEFIRPLIEMSTKQLEKCLDSGMCRVDTLIRLFFSRDSVKTYKDIPSFWRGSCCLFFSFLCCIICTIVCLFVLFIFSHDVVSLFSIYEFDCPSGIFRPSFKAVKNVPRYCQTSLRL